MMMEKVILRLLLVLGLSTFPFWLRKPPVKDWLLIFLAKTFVANLMDSILVQQKRISYPVRFLKKTFKTSILFDYLLFPIASVLYNQITYRSNLFSTLGKVLFFTIPMTVVEYRLEKKTKLITWKRWTWYHTFLTLTGTFWLVRGFIAVVRTFSNQQVNGAGRD
jgi:hypothetical protein